MEKIKCFFQGLQNIFILAFVVKRVQQYSLVMVKRWDIIGDLGARHIWQAILIQELVIDVMSMILNVAMVERQLARKKQFVKYVIPLTATH